MELVQLWTEVFGYTVSFLVIGNFWVDHRSIFQHVRQHTGSAIYIAVEWAFLSWSLLFMLVPGLKRYYGVGAV